MAEPDYAAISAALPLVPAAVTLAGRFVKLVPLDVDAHLTRVAEAFSGQAHGGHPAYDAHELIFKYMLNTLRCDDLELLRADLTRLANLPNGRAFVVEWSSEGPHPGLLVGLTCLINNRPNDLVIEIGSVTFTAAAQGTPANSEATYLLLRHAFSLGYRRVEWKANALNERSTAAARRMGFAYEGTFKKHMIVRGASRDTAWFAVTEWPSQCRALQEWLQSIAPLKCIEAREAQLEMMRAQEALMH